MTAIPRIEVNVKELEEILARSSRGPLSEEDREKLGAAVETLGWLTHELEAKRVSVARLKKLLFGQVSEKTAEVFSPEETACQDESAHAADGREGSAPGEEGGDKKERKGHGRNGAEEYKGAERVEIEHESLKPKDPCPKCDKGKVYLMKKPSLIVRIVGQAPLKATVYERQRLRCNLCGEVFTAKAPAHVGDEKYDATSASMVALLKYGSGMPFNRLERLEGSLGIPLPASTQWEIVHHAAELIEPVYGELIREAAQGEVLHNDDTGMKILELMGKRWKKRQAKSKKKGKGSRAKERTGVFTSGIVSVGERKIALFFTARRHAGENLRDVLSQRASELRAPVQMCDALSRNMPAELRAVVANCLAHGRRQFVDVAENFPAECRRVLETLREVYRNDATCREDGLSPEARLEFHRRHSRPAMVKLLNWFRKETREKRIEPNSSLGGAVAYMKKHWWKLTLFYRVPGAPLDNNVAERLLKRAILHRKNAYFFKSENGAHVGDLFMSLISTAELSGASPFDYLCELLGHAEELREDARAWMPWNYRERLAALGSRGP